MRESFPDNIENSHGLPNDSVSNVILFLLANDSKFSFLLFTGTAPVIEDVGSHLEGTVCC